MTVQLSPQLEEQLRRVARQRGREIEALIEEAVHEYLMAAAIQDVCPEDVAATQMELAAELRDVSGWSGQPGNDRHAAR